MATKYDVTSVRMSEDAKAKLNELREAWGTDTGATIDQIMEIVERSELRDEMPERQSDIDDFTTHLRAIDEGYRHSLRICRDAETRIRTELKGQLDNSASLVATMQDQLAKARTERDTAKQEAETAETENKKLAARVAELEARIQELEAGSTLSGIAEQLQTLVGQLDAAAAKTAKAAKVTK